MFLGHTIHRCVHSNSRSYMYSEELCTHLNSERRIRTEFHLCPVLSLHLLP